jgi:hypothetical protein
VPPVVPPVHPRPCGVPEPATIVSGLIGLAAAAGYRLRRRNETETTQEEKTDTPE